MLWSGRETLHFPGKSIGLKDQPGKRPTFSLPGWSLRPMQFTFFGCCSHPSVSRLSAQLRARSVETACAEQALTTGAPKRPRLAAADAMAQAAAASPRQAALEGLAANARLQAANFVEGRRLLKEMEQLMRQLHVTEMR